MSISQLSFAEEIDARAAEFILRRCDVKDWNKDDQAVLDSWLEESFAHRAAYWRLEAAWERADRLNALKRLSIKDDESGGKSRAKWAMGAVVFAFVVLGLATFFGLIDRHQAVYSTSVGGHRIIALDDGSRIELNTDTQLRIETKESERLVHLVRGEAFFQIRHDTSRPFVVLAGAARITDLGTKFLIRENVDAIRVSVVEGRARLDSGAASQQPKSLILRPGEEAVATGKGVSLTRRTVQEAEDELGWRNGVLVFHHTPLTYVAAEYNRYNNGKIIVAPSVADMTISATLPATDVSSFARMAQNFLGLHVEKYGGETVISR